MSTSGTYLFGSQQSEQIITDAYERIGTLPTEITDQQIRTAQRSINYILSSWLNRGLNLWTVQFNMLTLVANQNSYALPTTTVDILEVTLRRSNRNLGGTAASSAGGVAQNAFDGNPATACTQTVPNGNISYTWGQASFAIAMVGIQSNATLLYTLIFEYSNDGMNWFTALTPVPQTFTIGVNVWFIIPVPTPGTFFRVRETGGATLNIQELYFNTALNDLLLTPISRSEYMSFNQKQQVAQPTSYLVDKQIAPRLVLWPTPNAQVNALFFSSSNIIQDIGSMGNQAQIPVRFMESVTAGLAHKLAMKKVGFDLNKLQLLEAGYEKELKLALAEDIERDIPLRVYGDFSQGWTQT